MIKARRHCPGKQKSSCSSGHGKLSLVWVVSVTLTFRKNEPSTVWLVTSLVSERLSTTRKSLPRVRAEGKERIWNPLTSSLSNEH